MTFGVEKPEWCGVAARWRKKIADIFILLTVHERYGQTARDRAAWHRVAKTKLHVSLKYNTTKPV